MYYLFIRKEKDLLDYRKKFDQVSKSIKLGVTPVFDEMRAAKTQLIEALPIYTINGVLLILGAYLINFLNLNDYLSIAIVLIINSLCYAVGNFIFTVIKHQLRLNFCRRLGVPANEHSIAVMESLEYQCITTMEE